MGEIAQPHDRFVKAMLSDPEKAGTLFREWLPKEIAELLAPEPPEWVPGSFVDEELREHLTDRLYRAKTISGRTALLYALIDHKSSPDRKIGWQLLRYLVEALKQWERENPKWKTLPAIVPFVFYNGETEWKIPNEFLALVDAEEGWRPYLLNFLFSVLDLGKIPDKRLSREPRLRAWLLAAKYATRGDRQMSVKEFFVEVLAEVPEEDFHFILRYVFETYRSYDEQTLREIIRRVCPEEEEKMMSQFAQEIIAKGKPEWLRQGRHEGESTLLTRQLQSRFGDVPAWAREKMAKADPSTLEEWGVRVLNAKSLEAVFAS